MSEKQDMGVVTQSDREAAVDIYNVILHDWHTQHMLDGMEDECYVIQALKKHRLASQAGEGEAYPSLELCVQFTDDGQHIRKWSRLPFDGGECLYSHPAPKAHPPAAEPVGLREAVEGIDDDYMTSEKHHPGYVLIPTVKFEQIVSAAKRAKEIVPAYYVNWHHDADKALATPARTDDAGALLDRAELAWQRFFYPAADNFTGPIGDKLPSVDLEVADCLRLVLAAMGRHVVTPAKDIPALSPAPDRGEGDAERIERAAQWLHDEGGFDDAWPDRTWPEHPGDTGQRDGCFVKIVPSDVQAKFRDVATRMLRVFPASLSAHAGSEGE